MLAIQVLLIALLALSPRLWFRWWYFNRFTAYAWGILVFMACTALIYVNFNTLAWGQILGLFFFILVLSVARLLYRQKRADEAQSR